MLYVKQRKRTPNTQPDEDKSWETMFFLGNGAMCRLLLVSMSLKIAFVHIGGNYASS